MYYSEEFSKQYFKESWFGVFISTIVPSLFFQTVWFFCSSWFDYNVNLQKFGNLVSSNPSEESFKNIEEFSIEILLYQISMFCVAAFCGRLLRKIIRYYNLDRRIKILRFQNQWHYILKGEFYDFPRANISLEKDTVRDIELVFVDALIETVDGTYLYDGVLVDYELSSNGGLDTITLTQSERRKLSEDRRFDGETGNPYYNIEGHILLLKYEEIKNLNFTYYTLDRGKEGDYTPRMVM